LYQKFDAGGRGRRKGVRGKGHGRSTNKERRHGVEESLNINWLIIIIVTLSTKFLALASNFFVVLGLHTVHVIGWTGVEI
jgi:hypothetical protein